MHMLSPLSRVLGPLAGGAIALLLGSLGWWSLAEQAASVRQIAHRDVPNLVAIAAASGALADAHTLAHRALARPGAIDSLALAELRERQVPALDAAVEALPMASGSGDGATNAPAVAARGDLIAYRSRLVTALDLAAWSPGPARAAMQEVEHRHAAASDSLRSFAEHSAASARVAVESAERVRATTLVVGSLVAGVLLVAAVTLGALVAPAAALVRSVRRIGRTNADGGSEALQRRIAATMAQMSEIVRSGESAADAIERDAGKLAAIARSTLPDCGGLQTAQAAIAQAQAAARASLQTARAGPAANNACPAPTSRWQDQQPTDAPVHGRNPKEQP